MNLLLCYIRFVPVFITKPADKVRLRHEINNYTFRNTQCLHSTVRKFTDVDCEHLWFKILYYTSFIIIKQYKWYIQVYVAL